MPHRRHPPAHDHPPTPGIGRGASLYSSVLQGAGGQEVNALMRPGPDTRVCAALYAAPPYDLCVPPMDVGRLSINLTPARVSGGIAGDRRGVYEADPGSLFLAPAGAQMRWRKDASSRHLTLYFHADVLSDGVDSLVPLTRREALHNLRLPGLRPLLDALVDELRQGALHNTDAADCLARLVLVRLSRQLSRPAGRARALDAATLARLKDHVMDHLDQRLLVADLGAVAGLPIDRFAVSIKAATGQSPHQFVLGLRLQQARQLLRTTAQPIAEVAHACGFSSQQHLTNAMRRHAGVTPARCRPLVADRTGVGANKKSGRCA